MPWIFAREDGAPVVSFYKAWGTACTAAGFFRVEPLGQAKEGEALKTRKVPTKLLHDFRRSAVRNLIRAGVPETTAMHLTGHRTREVFKRYAIVDAGMLREAGEKLTAAARSVESEKDKAESSKVIALRG